MISEQTLSELERLAKKNNAVAELLEFYDEVTKSPYYDSYLSARVQISFWNEEIKERPTRVYSPVSEDGSFERAHKFISTQAELLEKLNSVLLKLVPQEEKEIEKAATSLIDEARIRMKEKNGEKV